MTAEVAIMNRSAVALAADSAVTTNYGRQSKVFNSANKLLMLCEDRPVGIMVFGNAEFVGVPWETLIKIYRARRRGEGFATLNDYSSDFRAFLSNEAQEYFHDEDKDNHALAVIAGQLGELRALIEAAILAHVEAGRKTGERSLKILAARRVTAALLKVQQLPLLEGFDKKATSAILRSFGPRFESVIRHVFDGMPLSDQSFRSLRRLCGETLSREIETPGDTGIVIAGFGDDEVFPSLRACRVYGYVAAKLRIVEKMSIDLAIGQESFLVGYAQQDMVTTFMEGVHPSYLMYGSAFLHEALAHLPEAMTAGLPLRGEDRRAVADRAAEIAHAIESMIDDRLGEYRQQVHVNPVLETIARMPKDELGALAEALVNLTSLKRHTTMVLETVGGPVDVAVISKGDGFVWLERKHYFRPELNPHFIARHYLRL